MQTSTIVNLEHKTAVVVRKEYGGIIVIRLEDLRSSGDSEVVIQGSTETMTNLITEIRNATIK